MERLGKILEPRGEDMILDKIEPPEPKRREPGEHRALAGNRVRHDAIERGNAVRGDKEKPVAEVEDLPDFSAPEFRNARQVTACDFHSRAEDNAGGASVESTIFHAAGIGPAATSFFLRESTAKERPSRVRAPRSVRSPGSRKNNLINREILVHPEDRESHASSDGLTIRHRELQVLLFTAHPDLLEGPGRNPSVFAAGIHQGARNGNRLCAVNMILQPATNVESAHGTCRISGSKAFQRCMMFSPPPAPASSSSSPRLLF